MRLNFVCILSAVILLSCGTVKRSIVEKYYADNITEIPDSVFRMKDLKAISIGPSWVVIAPITGYTGDAEAKKITTLPAKICELKNLKVLHLTRQNLVSLPECVYRMKNLEELDLSFNYKFELKGLIENASNFINLKKLNLYHVPISSKDSSKLRNILPHVHFTFTVADTVKHTASFNPK